MTALRRGASQSPEDSDASPLEAQTLSFHAPQDPSPSRKPFGVSDDEDSIRVRRQKRFAAIKHEVEDLRSAILRCRLNLRESRTELGRHRAKIRELESQLLKEMQSPWEEKTNADKAHMNQIYEEILDISDLLGPGEEEFCEKEDDLSVMEHKLAKLEDRYYRHSRFAEPDYRSEAAFISSSSEASSIRSPRPSAFFDVDELSPVHRYLSRVGDANIMKERLAELESQKSEYVGLEKERCEFGIPLYQPNVDFLEAFDRVYGQHLSELHTIEDDLAILGHEAGLAHVTKPCDAGSGSRPTTPKGYDERQGHEPWCNDGSIRRRSDGDLLGVPNDLNSARQRINQWILDRLIDSPIERALHKRILDDPFLDDKEWLALILEYWQKDRLAVPAKDSAQNTAKRIASSEGVRLKLSSLNSLHYSPSATINPTIDFDDSAGTSLVLSDLDTNKSQVNLTKFPPSPYFHSPISWSSSFEERDDNFSEPQGSAASH